MPVCPIVRPQLRGETAPGKKKGIVLANEVKYVVFIRITSNTYSEKYIYYAYLFLTLPLRFSKAGAAWGQKKGSKGLALHALY